MPNLDQASFIAKLTQSKNIVLVLDPQPLLDHVTAALALALGLTLQDKQVSILGKIDPSLTLPSQDLIKPELKGNHLILSWPDPQDSISQIMTETQKDRGRFAIIIQTKPTHPPVDFSQISSAYSGISADLILLIATSPSSITNQELSALCRRPHTTIRLFTSEKFPQDAYVSDYALNNSPALSFTIGQLLTQLKIKFTPDIATLILRGIEHRTERFANPQLPFELFTLVARCLESGGKRTPVQSKSSMQAVASTQAPKSQPSSSPSVPTWIQTPPSMDQTASLPTSASPDTIHQV